MSYENFSLQLKALSLGRDEFAKMVGMSYNSVANWKQKGVPLWVECFLFHYEKSKKLDSLLEILEKYKWWEYRYKPQITLIN